MTSHYYTVVCSLPRMNRYFKIEKTPISRIQLEKRLKLLLNDKFNFLLAIELLVWTSWFMPQKPVADLREISKSLTDAESDFLRNIIAWFLDLRSIFTALRIREEKKEAPTNPNEYWITPLSLKIIRSWNELDFGLKSSYPWLPKIAADIAEKNTAAVEEFLLSFLWRYLSLQEVGHYFDFEAILIYLLKWNIINYWSKFDQKEVLNSLNELTHQLLRKHLPKEFILTTKGHKL